MKSKIQISVDETNQPVIKIEYNASDDVRDLLVKKFIENFNHQSWAKGVWLSNDNSSSLTVNIAPISSEETLREEHEKIGNHLELINSLKS